MHRSPTRTFSLLLIILLAASWTSAQTLILDQSPARPDEWGYHPAQDSVSQTDPPGFSWRPQKGLKWEIQVGRDTSFRSQVYRASGIGFNVHCPPVRFLPGDYAWHYRGQDTKGQWTNWSTARTFTISSTATPMPLPKREDLLNRIPNSHPRLFMRPENVKQLRQMGDSRLKKQRDDLIRKSESLLKRPPSTEEPPKYPEGMKSGSDPWRDIWWGNRGLTQTALNNAAILGFTRLVTGNNKYGLKAKEILMECAKWDPKGSTGYRYNDEAGMPYAYYFSRTYTFVNDILTEDEKRICRDVMRIRGKEMYDHLCPNHLWKPYSSHSNRAWHFLGEVAIAFHGEIEEADDWLWFAVNVFFNAYPVWSDDDGGWHEGISYWASYQDRFTWWADVMREALGIDAFKKPFYSKAGYYPLYLMPAGKMGGGFGDLNATHTPKSFLGIMTTLAAQSGNGNWQWWVERNGGPRPASDYIGYIRGALPAVKPINPDNLPSSRLFGGTGQTYLNSNLLDATRGVQVTFKSSPFGTQSHGYEGNNAFLLSAYGKRLLIRSGRRDSYGSDHHKNWMWTSRSVNTINVNGIGQTPHSAAAQGRIVAFKTTPDIDISVGEAAGAFPRAKDGSQQVQRYERTLIFVKPDLLIVYDRLQAAEPAIYEYFLHGVEQFTVRDQHRVRTTNDNVVCDIDFLTPANLRFSQTDQYDPNPRERIKLREWHLTATTREKDDRLEFVTLYRPHLANKQVPTTAKLDLINGGYALTADIPNGTVEVILPRRTDCRIKAFDIQTQGSIVARIKRDNMSPKTVSLSLMGEK